MVTIEATSWPSGSLGLVAIAFQHVGPVAKPLLALAACNRLVLTPRLAAGANRWLRASVMAEIVLGLVLLAAAAWLAALPPAWQQSSADHSRPFLEVPNAESA